MNIRSAIYQALMASSSVTTKLAVYGGAPAVFTSRPVPQDALRPYAVVSLIGETDDGGVNSDRVLATFDVAVYGDEAGSATTIDALARAVRQVLHRTRLTIAGHHHIATRAIGQTEAPTDATISGRVLSFEVKAQ